MFQNVRGKESTELMLGIGMHTTSITVVKSEIEFDLSTISGQSLEDL